MARCNRCSQVLNASHGTTSLKKHVKICSSQEAAAVGVGAARPPQQQHPPPCAPSSFDALSDRESGPQDASKHLARMIALRGYDPSVVEDDCFRSFVASLDHEFRVPSRVDIEMCEGIFDEARRDLVSRLRRAPGRVSLAVGRVRTMEGEVLYTACHVINDKWDLHKVIMDAYGPLLGVHQAPLSPDALKDCIYKVMFDLSERDGLDNLFMIVWETTGNDIRLILREQIEEIQCNVNATRRIIISDTYMDNVIHSIARCLSLDPEYERVEISLALKNLYLTRQKRHKLLSQLGLDYNLRAYDEDWYSSYCSLEVLRNGGYTRNYRVSEFDELFCKLCGEMYRAIQRISASSCPTSNLCLVELFKLREVLQSQLALASGDNAIAYNQFNGFRDRNEGKDVAAVLREAMDRLDGSIKDLYLVWSIPLIVDPRYKLAYIEFIFQRAFADSEAASFISKVTREIKEMYARYIEYGAVTNSGNSDLVTPMAVGSSADPLQQAWDDHCRLQDGMTTEVTSSYQDAETELDRYLKDRLAARTEGFDILKWWKDNSQNYPTVARMARDALAMPTCSKLSSEQMAHFRSILRGYSKAAFRDLP